jgi:maltooligosyltrehalose trehalohydrolase
MGVDGLRLDAIHAIRDDSAIHVLTELCARVHAVAPRAVVIAESGLNDPRVIRPAALGGHGCDAQWADDFHHALRVLLTGERDGYYAEFGAVGQLAKAFRRPFVFDGTYSPYRRRRFGAPAGDRPLAAFATLLSPFTPMLFQGEEYGEHRPFQFFSDHIDEEIAIATRDGRLREFAQFAAFAGRVPDPQDPQTFLSSKLSRERDPRIAALYARLLAARRELGPGETEAADADEEARTLVVRRAGHELAMNFAREPRRVPVVRSLVVLGTHDTPIRDGHVLLPPLSGALIR